MALDTNLINAFAEQVTSAEDIIDSGEYYNGTVKVLDGKNYVQIDGSTTITPVAVSSVGLKDGNRVSCTIKDHRLSVIANMSDPSVNKTEVDEVKTKIIEVNTLIAEKVSTKDFEAKIADIENLKADKATIENLKADMLTVDRADMRYASIDNLNATNAEITNIKAGMLTVDAAAAKYATIDNLKVTNETVTNLQGTYSNFEKTTTEQLKATQAAIDHLDADKLDANDAEIKYATIKNLNAVSANVTALDAKQANFETATADNFRAANASIDSLKADKMNVTDANAKFANIDFANITEAAVKKIFSDSGIIKDLVVDEGKITGELVGVTIKGDLIEGGTVVADKLVVKGSNGLYYKLNTDGVTTEAEQTEYNSLNGSVITAKSITATKISVSDLVAFGATIAGYTIKDHALYSGAKASATNSTRGVYMNDSGEFSVGDANNYIRFWKDTDGLYKLALSASDIIMSSSGKTVEGAIKDAQDAADAANSKASNISVGGRNYVLNSDVAILAILGQQVNKVFSVSDYILNDLQKLRNTDITISGDLSAIECYGPRESAAVGELFVYYVDGTNDDIALYKAFGSTKDSATTYNGRLKRTAHVKDKEISRILCKAYIRALDGGTASLGRLKLEFGNTPTDWSPAPEDLQPAGDYATNSDLDDSISSVKSEFKQSMDGFQQTVEKTYATVSSVEQLQNIADSAIETWTGTGEPSDTKLPTSAWTTAALKKQHSGDVYYDTDSGYSYRYGSSDGINYSWTRIKDSDITSAMDKATSALSSANTAQSMANSASTAADKAQSTANNAQTNLNSFKDTVSSTYVTKTTFEQTSGSITSKVETAQTTANSASTAATKAQQTADRISLDLSKNYMTSSQINSAIDNISVGGRNLLLGTGSVNEPSKLLFRSAAMATATTVDEKNSLGEVVTKVLITRTSNTTGYAYLAYRLSDDIVKQLATDYAERAITVQIPCYADKNCTYRYLDAINLCTLDGANVLATFGKSEQLGYGPKPTITILTGTIAKNISITSDMYLHLYIEKLVESIPVNKTAYLYFKKLKLELGNKPTDWSPAPEDLQPAGDYATKTELKATSDSLTASVSSVKTIASNAQSKANLASTKIDSLKVGGRNLLLGTGVAKTAKGRGGISESTTLYNLTTSLYGLDVENNRMCESLEFMIDTEPGSDSTIIFQYGREYYGLFTSTGLIHLTSDMVGKYIKISSSDRHISGVTESADAHDIYVRLDNYTGNVIIRNAKLEYGTTATDWSPAPEDLATTNDVEEAKAYSAAQLKILSDNISTLVTDAAGKSMMTQTSSGWTFDMSKIQNGINKNANEIDSITGNLHNAEKTIDDINENVKKLLDTSAYISIGQDDDGNPRLELGRKDSPFRVAISNTSIDFLEGTDKIAYISNKQLYIYSSVVTDELKIGDSTGYIWKRRANNHLGLRYVTS